MNWAEYLNADSDADTEVVLLIIIHTHVKHGIAQFDKMCYFIFIAER